MLSPTPQCNGEAISRAPCKRFGIFVGACPCSLRVETHSMRAQMQRAAPGGHVPSAVPDNLERAFSGMSQELNVGGDIEHRVIVEGHDRALKPLIRDEFPAS